jgi:Icc-related predicted phosphoesterase
MKILLTSDLHYKLRQFDWLLHVASDFDAVVIAGDHIDAQSSLPGAVQIAALSATFAALAQKSRLFVCSGNHDLNGWNGQGEKVANWLAPVRSEALAVDGRRGLSIDGDTIEVDGTLFTVCPWWDGPYARAEVERMLESAAVRRAGRWVWVYHAPPEGLLSWTGKRHYGDAVLPELIQRFSPTAVLCGHIHEAPFKSGGSWIDRIGDTWLFNAGRQIGDIPARIEIDFAQEAARWISIAGVEERSLQ